MKLSKIILAGTACAASVVVSAMEFPTLRLTPFRPKNEAAMPDPQSVTPPMASCAAPVRIHSNDLSPAASSTLFKGADTAPDVTSTSRTDRLRRRPEDTNGTVHQAFDLQRQLHDCQLREVEYQHRLADLERQMAQKNAVVAQAIREMNAARQELVTVKTQLEGWSKHMADLRERLRSVEADNRATTQTFVQLLQQFLQTEPDTPPQPLEREKLPAQTPAPK